MESPTGERQISPNVRKNIAIMMYSIETLAAPFSKTAIEARYIIAKQIAPQSSPSANLLSEESSKPFLAKNTQTKAIIGAKVMMKVG